jgi:acyl-CoA synthetase (AMP-forming)/AMP-acid ligase II
MGLLLDSAGRPPQEIALDDLQGRRRTWAELDERASRIARLLRDDLCLRPNEHAAVLMENRAEVVEIILGAMLAGVWLTPVNHHLTAEEVAYVVEDSGARVLLMDAAHESVARAAVSGLSQPAVALVAGDELESAIMRASRDPLPADGVPGATMIYTSGTTGRPKGVKRARAATVAEAFAGAKSKGTTFGLDGAGPHLITGPLYHAAPLLFAIYDLIAGAPMIVMPQWDARRALDLIADRRVCHTHLVPTMFVRLLRLPEDVRNAFDPSSLRVVLHGAAPIAQHVKHAMIAWWGEVLVEYWGATESGVCTLVGSREWLEHPGTVGRPTASFEVFTADDHGHRLSPGEIGTLYIRHKRLERPFEYHRAADKTAEAYRDVRPPEPADARSASQRHADASSCADDDAAASGRDAFTIGDIGCVDAEGYVHLSDRKSHTIISGGVNIFPAEIEEVLHRHPAVADVAVFGIPDHEWGESVKAAVELVEGREPSQALEKEILAFAREYLAAYKTPRSIDFEARLPRHLTGKLYVRLLRERYWKDAGRSI